MALLYSRKGDDFLVHGTVAGYQSQPSIAVLASGGFVMTWTSSGGSGGDQSGTGIRAQMFDAAGAKVGAEFDINAATLNSQTGAVVAALPGGGFVVTWYDQSGTADTSNGGVTARIFTAAGAPAGAEFSVNTITQSMQVPFAVTVLDSGNFVIAWGDGSSGGTGAARAQIFTAAGEKVGGELLLLASYDTYRPGEVISLPGGGFAFAYPTWYQGVKLQMYDASGAAVGAPVTINGETDVRAESVDVAIVGDRIVAVWEVFDPQGPRGIEGQILDLNGVPIGPKLQISSWNANDQNRPTVMAMPGGDFLVTWQSDMDDDSGALDYDIRAQMFAADGSRIGGEFSPAGSDPHSQVRGQTAMLPSGDIVVAWYDYEVTIGSEHYDVRAQILTPGAPVPADIALSSLSVSEDAAADSIVARLSADGALNAAYTYTIVSDSSGGAFRIEGDSLVVADTALLDYESRTAISLTIHVDDGNGGTFQESFELAVTDVDETIPPASDEFLVASPDYGQPGAVHVTALASGGAIVTYVRDFFDRNGDFIYSRLAAQRYDADGNPVGETMFLGAYVVGGAPAFAELASGDIVMSWVGAHDVYTNYGSGGFSVGPVQAHATLITASGDVYENVLPPLGYGVPGTAIVALDSGGFVVLYDEGHVRAQVYDADFYPVGDFTVAVAGDEANFPAVVRLSHGGFFVTWRGADGTWHGQELDSTFTAAADPVPLLANPDATHMTVTAAAGGGFAMAWAEQTGWAYWDGADTFQIKLQLFDDFSGPIGDPVLLVEGIDASYGTSYDIAALPGGGFVLTWYGTTAGDPYYEECDAYALLLDAAGAPASDIFLVDSATLGWQGNVGVAVLQSGSLMFGWNDGTQLDVDVKARIVPLADAPPTGTSGTAGPDLFDGAGGDLVFTGRDGDDVYYVESGDTVVEQAGEGHDRVLARSDYTLAEGCEVEELATADSAGTEPLALTGNGFANRVIGNAGHNRIDGGGGGDAMEGRAGNDLYIVDDPADAVFEYAGEGTDAVESSVSFVLPDDVERLTLTGTAAIDATGNAADNALWGNAGANRIDGGLGADRMSGGDGDDRYVVDDIGDRVLEANATGGYDIVFSSISFSLTYQYLERLELTGTAHVNATGNSQNNTLVGNAGGNILDGGIGVDVMGGRGGDDTYIVDAMGDSVIESAGGGTDTVLSHVTFALSRSYEIENLTLIGASNVNAYGNHLNNRLEGNDYNNILNGSEGADTMAGRKGTDTYYVDNAGDVVIELANEGIDTVRSSVSYTLGDHVENLGLEGGADIDATGNALANRLSGNHGANRLDGGAGADVMNGYRGDDIYIVDNIGDVVQEFDPLGGNDTVLASVSYRLGGTQVETLQLTGNAAIDATGHNAANTLIGNDAANRLYGKLGNDVLQGGGGADGFMFDTALDGTNNVDAILDFSVADDTIHLSRGVFKTLGADGTLAASAFQLGTAAQDADDRIVYDAATGNVFYDADGNGAGAAVLFATVTIGTELTYLDFAAYTPV